MSSSTPPIIDPKALRSEFDRIRQQISLDFRTAELEVKQWTDWRHIVAEHPISALSLSALLGYWMVPGRSSGPLHGGAGNGTNGHLLLGNSLSAANSPSAAHRTRPGDAWRRWIAQLALQTAWRLASQVVQRMLRPSAAETSRLANETPPTEPEGDR